MIRCWPKRIWWGNLGRAKVRVILGMVTRVPGMQTRLAEVFHLGNQHRTRQGSSRMLRRRSSSKGLTMWSTDMMMVTQLWKESGTCVMMVTRTAQRWDPVLDRVS